METLRTLLNNCLYPIEQFFMPDSQTYWLYLLSSLIIALLLYLVDFFNTQKQEKVSFLQYCFPKDVYLHRSAILDYQNYLPMMAVKSFLIIPLTTVLSASVIARFVTYILTSLTDVTTLFPLAVPHALHHVAFSLFLILAIDFGYYYNHYLRHQIPVLWEFHKIHHTAEVLTPLTLYRHHPIDYVFQTLAVSLFSGVAIGLWTYLFGDRMQVIYLNGIPVIMFFFNLTGNFRHSHIWLAFPVWISHIFISPAQHHIHHGNEAKYYDTNYGKVFAIWDWMFGTLYVPQAYEKLDLGLSSDESNEFNSLGSFYFKPFKNVLKTPKNWNSFSLSMSAKNLPPNP
jgi:sterol desaturase/sphingolipid hydroxylase (fatty acid hydroxylase superfamily)